MIVESIFSTRPKFRVIMRSYGDKLYDLIVLNSASAGFRMFPIFREILLQRVIMDVWIWRGNMNHYILKRRKNSGSIF